MDAINGVRYIYTGTATDVYYAVARKQDERLALLEKEDKELFLEVLSKIMEV